LRHSTHDYRGEACTNYKESRRPLPSLLKMRHCPWLAGSHCCSSEGRSSAACVNTAVSAVMPPHICPGKKVLAGAPYRMVCIIGSK
jgi:hypothetical protein